MDKTGEALPYFTITLDAECDHLPWSSLVVSSYHFIDVTEQAVSPPQGMAEPRLSQIELVNICLACHRNVLQSSWVHWSTDEPTLILLGTGITVNPPKKTNHCWLSTNHKWHFLMPTDQSRLSVVWFCVLFFYVSMAFKASYQGGC